jgi:hypothetical protein
MVSIFHGSASDSEAMEGRQQSAYEHGSPIEGGSTVAMALSFVRGIVASDRLDEVVAPYRLAIAAGLPPTIAATYLLTDASGTVAVATVWRDRADLDAMVASGVEPFARRLIREAGGEPLAEFFNIAASSEPGTS